MCRTSHRGWLLGVVALATTLAASAIAADAPSPEETVKRYLGALQAGKPQEAYDYVSAAMKGGKSRDDWAKEQTEIGSLADVKIFGFDVGTAKVEGDVAKVPNVLRSQDKLVNQMGLTEYELYTLVKEDGRWKVDQQILVEPPDMGKWFPNVGKPAPATPPAPSPKP